RVASEYPHRPACTGQPGDKPRGQAEAGRKSGTDGPHLDGLPRKRAKPVRPVDSSRAYHSACAEIRKLWPCHNEPRPGKASVSEPLDRLPRPRPIFFEPAACRPDSIELSKIRLQAQSLLIARDGFIRPVEDFQCSGQMNQRFHVAG